MDSRRPNVLLICTDHWPGPLLGAAGKPDIFTATFDQLCANGVRFSNAYSETPTCIPARRGLMTGATARAHGNRGQSGSPLPAGMATLAGTFAAAGYQTGAVGKLHVTPRRSRIGFHEVLLCEEGRMSGRDDWELSLQDAGFGGRAFTHGMGTNDYLVRSWHLPERCHPTAWTTEQTCRMIRRREPDRPGFWYCSYIAPHPPITPPESYLEMYRDVAVEPPVIGDWAQDPEAMPHAARYRRDKISPPRGPDAVALALKGFYAQCTFIDHQIRLLIGTLREEGLLDETIIAFTSDHGDMLGTHGIWSKWLLYEYSAKVPLIVVPHRAGLERVGHDRVDERLCHLGDVMPTLLDLCGIDVPDSVDGLSLLGDERRELLYGEHSTEQWASRSIRDARFKLIYTPFGNRVQLFDLAEDPMETVDLAGSAAHRKEQRRLTTALIERLYGSDLAWVRGGELVGEPAPPFTPFWNQALSGQRGWR